MKIKLLMTACLLLAIVQGGAAQTVNRNMQLKLVLSNDTSDILKNVYIGRPRICLYGTGKRLKVRVRNEGEETCSKVHLILYYRGDKIFKSRLPVLPPQEEFGIAVNIKEDNELDLSRLEFKLYKKSTYRMYRPMEE